MNKVSIVVLSLFLGACSSLDSKSNFDNSVAEITPKNGYVEVTGQSYSPDSKANVGADILKSSLYFTYNHKVSNDATPESLITMDVSYFQSYKEYSTVNFFGKSLEINSTQVSRESCSEHCTRTQYFTFPLTEKDVQQARQSDLEFTLEGQGGVLSTTFIVPKEYIETIYTSASGTTLAPAIMVSAPVAAAQPEQPVANASKPVEMSTYWFEEVPATEKSEILNWAVENRSSSEIQSLTGSKEAEMFSYWFGKATIDERKAIIKQLL